MKKFYTYSTQDWQRKTTKSNLKEQYYDFVDRKYMKATFNIKPYYVMKKGFVL